MTSRDPATNLLHNMGGMGRASIVWRGFGREAVYTEAERIRAAQRQGAWVHFCISIDERDARYRRDWNSATALLQLIEPKHKLDEAAASRRLIDVIEAHNSTLDWPRSLLVSNRVTRETKAITLDHPSTAFVALAKSTGNLWLRDRLPRLAPLHLPMLLDADSDPTPGVRWEIGLWFPDGVPENLLSQALQQLRTRKRPRANNGTNLP